MQTCLRIWSSRGFVPVRCDSRQTIEAVGSWTSPCLPADTVPLNPCLDCSSMPQSLHHQKRQWVFWKCQQTLTYCWIERVAACQLKREIQQITLVAPFFVPPVLLSLPKFQLTPHLTDSKQPAAYVQVYLSDTSGLRRERKQPCHPHQMDEIIWSHGFIALALADKILFNVLNWTM